MPNQILINSTQEVVSQSPSPKRMYDLIIISYYIIARYEINSNMKIREAVLEPIISHLLQLCQQELQLNKLPPINLIDDKPVIRSGNKHSFGELDVTTIKIIAENRHPLDVMRKLALELVHWKQRLEGQEMDGVDGSETEIQANSVAGIIMRSFG